MEWVSEAWGENQVTIKYESLNDETIASIPLHHIQKAGFLFLWVINSKYRVALSMLRNWGYTYWPVGRLRRRLVGDITWVKMTVRGFLGYGNGHYLQHSKETCLVGKKGDCPYVDPSQIGRLNDVIFAKRKGQSQKPNEIYPLIESLVPGGVWFGWAVRRRILSGDLRQVE